MSNKKPNFSPRSRDSVIEEVKFFSPAAPSEQVKIDVEVPNGFARIAYSPIIKEKSSARIFNIILLVMVIIFGAAAIYEYTVLADTQTQLTEKTDLLNAKSEFKASDAAADSMIANATSRQIDVSSSIVLQEGLRTLVRQENNSASVVLSAKENLDAEVDKIKTVIEQTDVDPVPLDPDLAGTPLLDIVKELGGNTVSLKVGKCNFSDTIACVDPTNPNIIIVEKDQISKFDADQWKSILTHQFAHVVQYRYSTAFFHSTAFLNLFGANPETAADCMAQVKLGDSYKSFYGTVCSPEMLEIAANGWSGNWDIPAADV